MIQIFCDVCGESRKFRSGLRGDYRLWFTTIELLQVCDVDKEIPSNTAVDICHECRDKLIGWTALDVCLIRALGKSLENMTKETEYEK